MTVQIQRNSSKQIEDLKSEAQRTRDIIDIDQKVKRSLKTVEITGHLEDIITRRITEKGLLIMIKHQLMDMSFLKGIFP